MDEHEQPSERPAHAPEVTDPSLWPIGAPDTRRTIDWFLVLIGLVVLAGVLSVGMILCRGR